MWSVIANVLPRHARGAAAALVIGAAGLHVSSGAPSPLASAQASAQAPAAAAAPARVRHNRLADAACEYDVCVVGGGIVGLATARELLRRHSGLRVVVCEKEAAVAQHQTGHNSGVIHCGIYYKPGSLKAKLCVKGNAMMYDYIKEKGIPYVQTGKLIVAVDEEELPRLRALYENGIVNGVPGISYLDSPDGVREVEPHCAGIAAIKCTSTGIVDYGEVARHFARDIEASGGNVRLLAEVESFVAMPEPESAAAAAARKERDAKGTDYSRGVRVLINQREEDGQRDGKAVELTARHVITCGGLHSDRLARRGGGDAQPTVLPFRGEYLRLKDEKRHLVKGNIYPVPDPRFPFLGFHFTPRMDGSLWLGPNAVVAFAREGYNFWDINWRDLWEVLRFEGLWRLALSYLSFGAKEFYRSRVVSAQVKGLQRYVPELQPGDVERGPAGVRAMAVHPSGEMVGDFVFDSGSGSTHGRLLHVRNAPSPAATSSLSIAEVVADRAEADFALDALAHSRRK